MQDNNGGEDSLPDLLRRSLLDERLGGGSVTLLQHSLLTKPHALLLLRAILHKHTLYRNLVFLSLDRPPHACSFPMDRNVDIIDCFSDPLGWKSQDLPPPTASMSAMSNSLTIHKCTSSMEDIKTSALQHITHRVKDGAGASPVLVVIDSLSSLLQRHPVSVVCKLLQAISNLSSKEAPVGVVGLVQQGLHSTHDLSALQYISSMIVQVLPGYTPANFICSSLYKRKAGRVARKEEVCDFLGGNLRLVPESTVQHNEEGQQQKEDPMQNLPFNMQLSESEKAAREAVVLPYRHHMKSEQSGAAEDKHVEEDEGDDDLDDDLDI